MTTPAAFPIIDFVYTPVANYAIQQNRVPLVRKLVLENPSEEDLLDLTVAIKGEPQFTNSWEHKIEILVRYSETDQMSFVYHGNYVKYFEMGRIAWLKNKGY